MQWVSGYWQICMIAGAMNDDRLRTGPNQKRKVNAENGHGRSAHADGVLSDPMTAHNSTWTA